MNKNKKFNFCYMTRIDLVLTDDLKTYIVEINDHGIAIDYFKDEEIINLNINPIPFSLELSVIILNNRNITNEVIEKHNFTQICNKNENKVGGNNYYYDKYIKYKTKYLKLVYKSNYVNNVL